MGSHDISTLSIEGSAYSLVSLNVFNSPFRSLSSLIIHFQTPTSVTSITLLNQHPYVKYLQGTIHSLCPIFTPSPLALTPPKQFVTTVPRTWYLNATSCANWPKAGLAIGMRASGRTCSPSSIPQHTSTPHGRGERTTLISSKGRKPAWTRAHSSCIASMEAQRTFRLMDSGR